MNEEPPTTKPPPWWSRIAFGRHPKRTLLRLLIWICLVVFVFKVLLIPVRIRGTSMLPTYRDGGVNVINPWAYRNSQPKRGDVVAIRYAGKHVMLLKRIIGLPGERVAIENGTVLINGVPLDEPYVKNTRAQWNCAEVELAPNKCFVIGDNRRMDQEEHLFGEAQMYRIVGKAVF